MEHYLQPPLKPKLCISLWNTSCVCIIPTTTWEKPLHYRCWVESPASFSAQFSPSLAICSKSPSHLRAQFHHSAPCPSLLAQPAPLPAQLSDLTSLIMCLVLFQFPVGASPRVYSHGPLTSACFLYLYVKRSCLVVFRATSHTQYAF